MRIATINGTICLMAMPGRSTHAARIGAACRPLAVPALAAVGVLIRWRLYLHNRAFWSDEALLALNVRDRDFIALLTHPLDYDQAAPPGFLASTKALGLLMGYHDFVLRLLPAAFGIGSVLLAVLLARRTLQTALARATFVGLVALSPVLLYYGTEFKPYAGDVFFTLAVLTTYARHPRRLWLLAALGAVGVFYSIAIVFVLAAVGAAMLVEAIRRREPFTLLKLAAVGGCWAGSLAVVYALSLDDIAGNPYLRAYWRSGFAPFPASGWAEARWYVESWVAFVHTAFRQMVPEPPVRLESWFAPWNLLLAALSLACALWALARRSAIVAVVALTALANLVASVFEVYPLRNRMVLYLVPLFYWTVAVAVDAWRTAHRPALRAAGAAIAAILLATLAWPAAWLSIRPVDWSNVKQALTVATLDAAPGDKLSMNAWATAPFAFYRPGYGAGRLPVSDAVPDGRDPDAFVEALQAETANRVWILYMHDPAAGPFFATLAARSDLETKWSGDRGALYVLDIGSIDAGRGR